MVVSRKETPPNINIYINDTKLQQRDQFKYLGALISSDGRDTTEISSRIAQSKTMFRRMKNILTNPHMSIETRKRVLECYFEPILMYVCETWIISKQTRGMLEATEMCFLRRMMRIPWIAKKTNDTVLSETKTKRALINKMRKRQATFFGHIMRRERQEHLVTTGMFMGRRGRGRLLVRKRLTGWRLG
ncbi:endonuclease-reverse transcriptase [Elysia marginata]|uniref:Endonuclease-reverse transcriptase n=1 Tax=Elysia marginata TaxID=1093978 RepID=A0AAV4IY80_9GAST|nr:endonuclease-reverse transcriptase [Elysia marginata]